jgi:plasmid stabilization system protein ParE
MKEFVLHPEAYRDIEEIWEYIAADNLTAADRIVEEIYGAIRKLAPFRAKATRAPISPRARCGFTSYEIT